MAEPSHSTGHDPGGRIDELESGFADLARDQIARDVDEQASALEHDAREKLIVCARFLLPRKPNLSREDAMHLARMRRDARRRERERGWDEWDPPPRKKSLLEKAWPEDSRSAARRWIVFGWVPTVEPVRRTLGREAVEEFEAASPVHKVIRTLYLRLFDEGDREQILGEIEGTLKRLRSDLRAGDALPWIYFELLAGQIGAESCPPRTIPREEASTEAVSETCAEDELRVVRNDRGHITIARLVDGKPIDQAQLSRPSLIRLFEIVSARPDDWWSWPDLHRECAEASGWKTLLRESTLMRYGRDIRDILADAGLSRYWRYSSDNVGWFPSAGPASE